MRVDAVVTSVDPSTWLSEALGDADLDDGRTITQVVVGQAEFADVLVLSDPEPKTLAVLRRLAPLARITVGSDPVNWRSTISSPAPGAGAAVCRTIRC